MENDIILSSISKEKFRRRLLISSRILSCILIISIFTFSYIEFFKWKEFNSVRLKYGDNGYCYMCGLKGGRQCSCAYLPDLAASQESINNFKSALSVMNVQECENRNDKKDINISSINFTISFQE